MDRLYPGMDCDIKMRDMRARVLLASAQIGANAKALVGIIQGMEELQKLDFELPLFVDEKRPDSETTRKRLVADLHVFESCGSAACVHGVNKLVRWRNGKELLPLDELGIVPIVDQLLASQCIVRVAENLRAHLEEVRNHWGYSDNRVLGWVRSSIDQVRADFENRDLIWLARNYNSGFVSWIRPAPRVLEALDFFFNTLDPSLLSAIHCK